MYVKLEKIKSYSLYDNVGMGLEDVKEKLILTAFMIGLFLPLRLVFSEYLSEYWLGSFGIMTLFGFSLILLSRKQKLGYLGKIIEKQILQIIRGKIGVIMIIFFMTSIVYFGGTLYLIERGNTVFEEDKLVLMNTIFLDQNEIPSGFQIQNQLTNHVQEYDGIELTDYVFSITYAIMNDLMDGWLVHLHLVFLAEQIEIIGFLLYYKRVQRNVILKTKIN